MEDNDPTEGARRAMQAAFNAAPDEKLPQPLLTTQELQAEYEVLGFAAPFVLVRRKLDGAKGTLMFRHMPRVYFDFKPDAP